MSEYLRIILSAAKNPVVSNTKPDGSDDPEGRKKPAGGNNCKAIDGHVPVAVEHSERDSRKIFCASWTLCLFSHLTGMNLSA